MNQRFANRRVAGGGSVSVDAGFLDVMSDYFAYIAVVSVAAVTIAVSPGFLENTSVGFPETMAKPALFVTPTLADPELVHKLASAWRTSTQDAR